MEFDNEMKGALFPAEKKTENHPDYTGKVQIEGKEWRLAAWSKDWREGQLLSIRVSEFEKKEEKPEVVNDDVPF